MAVDFGEIGLYDTDWMHLARDKDNWKVHENTVMNHWIP
jgi:hypothetical protein